MSTSEHTVSHPADLTRDAHLEAAQLPASLLKIELALMRKKWFDYRFAHPIDATRLFIDAYIKFHPCRG